MSRNDFDRLRDMADAAERAIAFCGNMTFDAFERDDRTQYAVVRCLEIVGEAANRVDQVTRSSVPKLPWVRIIHMRHRLAHDYFQINLTVVWRTVHDDLPSLVQLIRAHLRAMEADEAT